MEIKTIILFMIYFTCPFSNATVIVLKKSKCLPFYYQSITIMINANNQSKDILSRFLYPIKSIICFKINRQRRLPWFLYFRLNFIHFNRKGK